MYDCSICGGGGSIKHNYHYDPPLFLCEKCKYSGNGKHKLISCYICNSKSDVFFSHPEYEFICKSCDEFLCAGFRFYSSIDFSTDNEDRFDSNCDGCIYYRGGENSRYECNILFKILSLQENYNNENPQFHWFLNTEIIKIKDHTICLKKSV